MIRQAEQSRGGTSGQEGPRRESIPAGGSLSTSRDGFTLVEIAASLLILLIGLGGLGVLLVGVSHRRESIETSTLVLNETQSLMERILATDAAVVVATHDGKSYPIDGVTGGNSDGTVLSVDIVSPGTGLVTVTITGSWLVRNQPESLTLVTEIYVP